MPLFGKWISMWVGEVKVKGIQLWPVPIRNHDV